jgi:hypothetical protein
VTFALLRASLVAAACACAAPAHAVTCYVIFDRHDNVIYRDVYPPVDMSNRGSPAREAMRQRGEYMMFVDVERCTPVEFLTGDAGSTTLDFARTSPSAPSSGTTQPPASARPMARPAPRS